MPRARERYLNTADAAKILNLSTDMVRRLERRGKLPAEFTTAGWRIFRLSDVEALARARGVGGELEPPDAA